MLHYYSRYTLAEILALPTEEFLFLFVGMLDNLAPSVTEPTEEKVNRLTREAHFRAIEKLSKGR